MNMALADVGGRHINCIIIFIVIELTASRLVSSAGKCTYLFNSYLLISSASLMLISVVVWITSCQNNFVVTFKKYRYALVLYHGNVRFFVVDNVVLLPD